MAKELVARQFDASYFVWDKLSDRKSALKGEWPPDCDLVILDEFHKHKRWKTWIKGEFDSLKNRFSFLLTGSARLNIYRWGGDSLQGRYHYYTLHPFSIPEIDGVENKLRHFEEPVFQDAGVDFKQSFDALFNYGGFPEPFIKQDERFHRRWRNERVERFFREDIRELTMIRDFGSLALLSELLPEKTASLLSINSLAEDLQVNFRTVANWLDVFEQFYYCFRIGPYLTRKVAAIRKAKKLYLWDWSDIEDPERRLENFVASHLLKFCDYLQAYEGYKTSLNFLRDSTGREVDFLVCVGNKPWFSVEVKNSDSELSNNILYFKEKLSIPFNYQISRRCKRERIVKDIRVMPVEKFLTAFI